MKNTARMFGLIATWALITGCGSSSVAPPDPGSSVGGAASSAGGAGGSTSAMGGSIAGGGGTSTAGAGGANPGDAAAGAGGSAAGAGGSITGGAGSGGSGAAPDNGAAGNKDAAADASATNGNDVVGKISVGYQGWFTAAGDGSGINPPWWHITSNRQTPTATNIALKSWPDMTDITKSYATGFANLGNGKPATLFSSYDASTVDTHVRWMQENGIDTIAVQRFGDFMDVRDTVTEHVRDAALARGRAFYVMYDISGWTDFQTGVKSDWNDRIVTKLHLTDSPAYARQDGKPVVCIWGIGFLDRPGDPTSSLDIINFFKKLGIYVIGGVGPDWRTADGTRWSKTGFGAVYDALNAISPWMVGVIGDNAGSDGIRKERNEGDVAYCHSHGIHYQPCVLPGDLQGRQRKHGDFMWHQFANMIQIGSDGIYISMYDEYNEGNQIAKTAATSADKPAGSSFITLDEDGTACSSDYYLRLTGDGSKMLKKQTAFTFTRPTSPT